MPGISARFPGGISAFPIRIFAVVFMIVDHFAAALVGTAILPKLIDPGLQYGSDWLMFYDILRDLGRFTFPVFCFFLSEGVRHTGNVKKYAMRLLIVGIISEIPFDMAIKGSIVELSRMNTFLTLLFGMLLIYVARNRTEHIVQLKPLRERDYERGIKKDLILIALMAAASFLAAKLLRTDYSMRGIGLIFVMFVSEEIGRWRFSNTFFGKHVLTALVGVAFILLEAKTWMIAVPAVMLFFMIVMYNGERGRKLKWFFYYIYPIHLFVFGFLRMTIG